MSESDIGDYVYKVDTNWSLLTEGITLPVDNQVVFTRNMGHFLKRGENRNITVYLDGKGYKAIIRNVNFDPRFNRTKDTLQIRYAKNGDLAKALQKSFSKSYGFFSMIRSTRPESDRTIIRVPDEIREYLAIYTTQYEDSYVFSTIEADDIALLSNIVKNQPERMLESSFNYDIEDKNAKIYQSERIVKIRIINKKIGDNLKLLYDYRCQICGKCIGDKYNSNVVEAHHIDYFVNSLNNDSDNQMIVCPNHHSIIHDINPVFDRKDLLYMYPNGLHEGLVLNKHISLIQH